MVNETRFTRKAANVKLATNTKENFELLSELFAGNDLYEQAKTVMDVKLTKMVDMI